MSHRGGAGYLLVWSDDRSALSCMLPIFAGPRQEPEYGYIRDVLAARLEASGAVLDTVPIVIARGALDQRSPRAAWNGSHRLVT